MAQEEQVVGHGFAKAQPWIDQDPVRLDARDLGSSNRFTQKRLDVVHHIAIARSLLHRPGVAPHMHEDDRHARSGDHRAHVRIPSQGGDIVHQGRPGVNRASRDFGF